MKKYLVNLFSWENPRLGFSDSDFEPGDKVVMASELGNNLGTILANDIKSKEESGAAILRQATAGDLETYVDNEARRDDIIQTARSEAKRLQLEMKLIDSKVSLDGSGIAIIFTAEERVDFRELVKNLARIFRRSIKMHQIGSREEARKIGGCGVCGRDLCCVRFPGSLPSISTEMARVQQIAHRGSERISGLCGRLMCCLAYEADQYREMLVGMPEVGSSVKTDQAKGQVIELNVIKREVKIRQEDGSISVVRVEDIK